MKFSQMVVLAMSAQCFFAATVFAYQHNWKLAAYWFLVSAINAVASTF